MYNISHQILDKTSVEEKKNTKTYRSFIDRKRGKFDNEIILHEYFILIFASTYALLRYHFSVGCTISLKGFTYLS